jgi:hypothetical protein
LPAVELSGVIAPNTPPPTVWDEQLGLSFTQDFTNIAYNVTAVEQADLDGYGPAYLLSGLSSKGYWYQVGLSWNWGYKNGGYSSGFNLNYEVFDSSGSSIYPSSGGSGLAGFSRTVNQGDTVLLNLYFSSGNVIMYGYDFDTGVGVQESYSAEGATYFAGTPHGEANSKGFFTGLMTEWWHVSRYYGGEASVLYSDSTFALSSAWMWIDEWNPSTKKVLFSDGILAHYSSPRQLQHFSSNGATEASDAYVFITGTGTWVPMTMSYSVVRGGTGYAPPLLTYMWQGDHYVTPLSTSPTTYYMDSGSFWSVNNPLSGSSETELWSSKQQTSGIAISAETVNPVYYHQYLVNLGYSVGGTGVGYSPPRVAIEQFGATSSVMIPANVFIDAGSQYSYQNPLLGSSSSERWFSASPQGVASSSFSVQPTYYHQYPLTASYSIVGGGNPGAPFLVGTSLGSTLSTPVTLEGGMIWLDEGSMFSVPNLLPASSSTERWYSQSLMSASMHGSATISPVYYHQYLVSIGFQDATGMRTVTPDSMTAVGPDGNSKTLTSYSSLWLDEGQWVVSNILWQGIRVELDPYKTFSVSSPTELTLRCAMYDVTVTVQDVIGFKITGAQVKMTLPYGNVSEQSTGEMGTATFTSVPRGSFSISVTNMGFTTTLDGDASVKNDVTVVVTVSIGVLVVGVAVIGVLGAVVYLMLRRRRAGQAPPLPLPPPFT